MSRVISSLQKDHAHFLKILDSLEGQVKLVARGGKVDRRYIQMIIEYFNGYPRRLHYRKEETLLKMLEERAPHLCPKINVVLRCHRTLDDRLSDLEDRFHTWRGDDIGGRAPFVTAASRFIEFERNHFADENEHLFPVALKMLSEAEIDAAEAVVEKDDGVAAFSPLDSPPNSAVV